jgi:uncharacterized protein
VNRLRALAVANNFSQPRLLQDAVTQLGFVQADPIRSPARAQDLILRQRVSGYRVGDLEANYASLDLEEDFLYAYGFLTRSTWRLLHPRKPRALKAAERRVHELLLELGEAHPAVVARRLGAGRAVNPWGGMSTASTRVLHYLHWYGLLRVVRREKGTRVYMPAQSNEQPVSSAAERLRRVVLLVARILAPVPEASLKQTLSLLNYCHLPPVRTRPALGALLESGELVRRTVDGLTYLVPADLPDAPEAPALVRILAPFDPLVWDRRRFEHLWGWAYRFEAYTPAPKRKLGYYAMPMLWRDRVIGWVNATVSGGRLIAEPGFVTGKAPRDRQFRTAYDEELTSLADSLGASAGRAAKR